VLQLQLSICISFALRMLRHGNMLLRRQELPSLPPSPLQQSLSPAPSVNCCSSSAEINVGANRQLQPKTGWRAFHPPLMCLMG
jgi:hypothetical protein